MKAQRLNDEERRQWIDNDEGLYQWWRTSRLGKREFIRRNRAELDKFILAALNQPPAPLPNTDYRRQAAEIAARINGRC